MQRCGTMAQNMHSISINDVCYTQYFIRRNQALDTIDIYEWKTAEPCKGSTKEKVSFTLRDANMFFPFEIETPYNKMIAICMQFFSESKFFLTKNNNKHRNVL